MMRAMARPSSAGPAHPPTATRILDVAERLLQTRGYNGFSYADISEELGITKASLHHHFATKAELGNALVRRYAAHFAAALREIDARATSALGKLERYAHLYEQVVRGERLCLCGMLAAEYGTLPKPMQEQIRRFFDANEAWLAAAIEHGRRTAELRARGTSTDLARLLLAALEGAMLVAHPFNDVRRFTSAARAALAGLAASG
jgi:TetR/AcrR family transcriptional repressor of nem operon